MSAGAGLPTAPAYTELTGSAAANNTDLIASTDVRGYHSFSIVLTGTFSATVRVQGSNDGTNWEDVFLHRAASLAVSVQSMTLPNLIYVGGISTRYLRVRTTAYVSGTVTATLELSTAALVATTRHVYIDGSTTLTVFASPSTAASSTADANTGTTMVPAGQYAYVAGASGVWDRIRTPNVFKTAAATASGNTAIWTPASGRKFRLMRYRVELSGDAAISGGGVLTVKFQDATTDINLAHSVYVPAVAGTAMGAYSTGWNDLGNGILSAAANNVLNVNLSAALTSGTCRVIACGTEE